MKNFEYKKVFTLKEALLLLAQHQEGAKILAGGTALLVKMHNKVLKPEILVDIKGIRGLEEIRYDPVEGLSIGALALIHSLETSQIIREKFEVISEAAGFLGSLQIRNRGTLGGNLCNASPAGDMAPCLISLSAKAKVMGGGGERFFPLEEFFMGPGKTALKQDELLTAVQVPNLPPRTGCMYTKHSIRKAMDWPVVGVAVALTLDSERDKCRDIKIALGAAAPVPMRAQKAEDRLRGQRMDETSIAEASRLASEEARPITDIRASAEYRREMVRVITQKTLKQVQEALS